MERKKLEPITNLYERLAAMEARLFKQTKHRKKPIFDITHAVEVVHEDGSRLLFQSAFAIHEDEYFFVFTEHQGSHFYHQDDATIYTYTRVPMKAGNR